MKIKAFTLIRVTVSLALIALLLWTMRDKQAQVIGIIKNIDLRLLIAGAALFISSIAIIGCRLRYLLTNQGLLLNYSEAISLTFIGYFFNNFLPTSIGGDVVKAYYASKKTANKVGCFATVLMDRLLGMFSLLLIATVILVLSSPYQTHGLVTWPIFTMLGLTVVLFFIMWNKRLARKLSSPFLALARWLKLEEKLKRVYNTINSFKDKKILIIRVILISIIAHLVCFSSLYFWAKGVGNPVSMRIVFLTMPLIAIFSIILPSVNGLGVREWAIVFFFGPHVGEQNAFALSILWLIMLFVISIIGGLNYAFSSHYKLDSANAVNA